LSSVAVAVIPDAAGAGHRPLLAALEQAYPVRFVGGGDAELAAAAAVVVFPGGRLPERLAVPSLVLEGEQAPGAPPFQVRLQEHHRLAPALRGQRLVERTAPAPGPLAPAAGQEVLAAVADAPVWLRSDDGGIARETAAAAPPALEQGDVLRDHLTVGRFWSLLPIVHFLRGICGQRVQPPLRACFVIDDPNIRFSSYGSIRYAELAADAREHGYHVAIATIPLDLTLPGHRAAAVFREHPRQLSLAVHGNDHLRLELERARSARDADRLVATAIARVERFERRASLRIERVMCPPHGGCSPATLRSLFTHGFLGLAASRPFPWKGFGEHDEWPAAGWLPAQLAGGLPVLPRYSLAKDLDDLVFRALLGQPLIIYCHQADLRPGLDPFREAAARTARLGDVEWTSLAEIARHNVSVHESSELATVTLYSRDARVRRPRAPRLRIEVPRIYAPRQAPTLWVDGIAHDVEPLPDGRGVVTVANDHSGELLRVRLVARDGATRADVAAARPGAWPLARRAMTEGRDRIVQAVR
jgi:hypothetical protein